MKNIFIILGLIASISAYADGAVKISAQIDSSKDIYTGESFTYYIIIEGAEKAGQVDITPLMQFNPQHTGNRQQSSTQIINNRVTTTKTIIMTYSLRAASAGRINLPPLDVTLDGNNYKTNPLQVNILKPGTTDQLDLQMTLSHEQCYVGQPVIITIKFYVSAEIDDSRFNIPAFTSGDFYIEDPDTSNQQEREYNLGDGTIVRVSQYRTVHNGKEVFLISFSKVLIPKNPGQIIIEPASVSADVAVGTARSRDRFFDDFFGSRKEYKRFQVSSDPAALTVLPLPQQGQPSEFYGLVGQYTISASAAPAKVNVGDPITLTIKVGGGRFLKPVQWPALEKIPQMADNFKIPSEKASPTIENGQKIFIQTIRASNDRVTEIPPIPLAYFNVETGEYDIAKTEPIKLEVSPTKILTNADLQGLDSDFQPLNKEVEAIKKGLSANYEDLDALINQTFSPLRAAVSSGYSLIWAAPLIVLVLSALAKLFTHTTPEKIAAARRRNAAAKAVRNLKQITSLQTALRHQHLADVMKQYLGDRFDKTAGSLTSNDCFEIIAGATDDSDLADKYQKIIADCEAARYASYENQIDAAYIARAVKLIRDINKKSSK